MITAEQKQFIAKHVDCERYDVERLTKYLSMHDVVGAEIFQYCEKEKPNGRRTLSTYFEDDDVFMPMNVDAFIHRITCNCKQSEVGRLTIVVKPTTVIKALNFYSDRNDDEDVWYQLYAGPLNMEFDYTALRDARDRLGYTQQQVADAVGTSVRTYQKWEAGNTTPDGYFLLKLLNWLDISDIQNVVKYK